MRVFRRLGAHVRVVVFRGRLDAVFVVVLQVRVELNRLKPAACACCSGREQDATYYALAHFVRSRTPALSGQICWSPKRGHGIELQRIVEGE